MTMPNSTINSPRVTRAMTLRASQATGRSTGMISSERMVGCPLAIAMNTTAAMSWHRRIATAA